MKQIAFLGLGAMGSRMADGLLQAGHRVTVWNRSPEKAETLCAKGAFWAENPAEAAADADVVLSMVRDDEASSFVWLDQHKGALNSMRSDAIAVECSTLSVNHIKTLHSAFVQAERSLVEAPVAGSRPQAEARKLIFFAAGLEQQVKSVQPLLEKLASAVHYCGEAGTGCTMKLMVNVLFGAQIAQLAEIIVFGEKLDMDPARAVDILAATPVCSPIAALSAQAMLAGNFAPAFPIDLVCKDFNMFADSADLSDIEFPLAKFVGDIFHKGAAKGYVGDNITGIIQIYRPKK